MNNQLPLISIIITTKNEEKNIENCLKSILTQTYPSDKMEIIVVDNNSTDKTKEIAQKYTEKVYDKGPERSAQRNFGVENSRGEYFLYLDADMIMSPDLVTECVKTIQIKPDVIALYISEIVLGKKYFSKVRRFERSFYDGTVIDCARFIKKDKFFEVGKFDLNLTGPEDWDLDKKLRNIGKVELLKSAAESDNKYWELFAFVKEKGVNPEEYKGVIFHNEAEFILKKYLDKKWYYAQKFDEYINKWGKNDEDIKKQFSITYRFFKVFNEDGKWKKLKNHPVLASGLFYLRTLVGFVFLTVKNNKLEINAKSDNNLNTNQNLPSISFVIPVYNAQKHLEKCLESINKQDYPQNKLEIIIIDGGSTDKTVEIAKKYNPKILFNKNRIAEYGKSIGIKASTGDYFILLDSDNELVENYWISEIIKPILKEPNLFGVESPFSYDKKLSSLNRYFGRMRINDPFANLLANKPKVNYKKNYDILEYKANKVILTGANGFIWNKKMIMQINIWREKFEEGNFGTLLHSLLGVNYAVANNISTRHYYVENVYDYIKKRKKIALKVKGRMDRNEFIWAYKVNKIKFVLAGVYSISIVGPLFEATYKNIKDKTFDWFWHPIISFLTILIYGITIIPDKILCKKR